MKKVRYSKEDLVFNIINYSIMIIILLVILYPLYFVVIASFSESKYVAGGLVWLHPVGFTLKGYKAILEYPRIWIGYRNTLAYTTVGTLINLAVTIPAGYALSRKDLYGRNVIMGYFVFTMFFSGGLVPSFMVVKGLGLVNTFWVMVILGAISVWNMVLCRTFFSSTIPHELWESASLDGCRNVTFFFKIVLPLSKTIIAVMALFCAVGHWNEYKKALIYLNDRNMHPLQLVLRDILIVDTIRQEMYERDLREAQVERLDQLIRYGSIIVAAVPVLVIYPFLQRYFIKGVMIGSLKC